jgi:hypothetical protein
MTASVLAASTYEVVNKVMELAVWLGRGHIGVPVPRDAHVTLALHR